MPSELRAISFAGIRPDSLGNYLVGLGLLFAVSTNARWRAIRGCWQNGHFVLLGEDLNREEIEQYLFDVWVPTFYERWWENEYKEDRNSAKKNQPVEAIARSRAKKLSSELRSLDATVVILNRPVNNPIFGNLAGMVGARRNFSNIQKACLYIVKVVRSNTVFLADVKIPSDLKSYLRNYIKLGNKKQIAEEWLRHTLRGESCNDIPPIGSTGTWFVYANRAFNSGQSWYREGQISPWSFLLALEGALLLVGGVARRLSANARPYAIFPFVSEGASPIAESEVGLARAEFWAPLWQPPATLAEVRALLERGLARIGDRAAKAPHEFAIAARAAGVDAGVTEFVRFMLRQTTSSQVYEAIPGERIKVSPSHSIDSQLIEPLINVWIDRLPFEPHDSKQRGKFKGLRGPIEDAIIRIAERPDDPERWQRLLLVLAEVQDRIDHNKELRKRCRALPWLDPAWFRNAWPAPSSEIQVACAIASIGIGTDVPILCNIYGVELNKGTPTFAGEQCPQRVVWHNGDVVRLLVDILERRLVDTDATAALPLTAHSFCRADQVSAFLEGALDLDEIKRWIPPLALIDWSKWQPSLYHVQHSESYTRYDGSYLLHSLFRPLFYPDMLQIDGNALFPAHLRPRPVIVRRLLNLIRQGEGEEAVQLARSRYLAAGHATVFPPCHLSTDYERLAASLLIPMRRSAVVTGLSRWLQLSTKKIRGERQ